VTSIGRDRTILFKRTFYFQLNDVIIATYTNWKRSTSIINTRNIYKKNGEPSFLGGASGPGYKVRLLRKKVDALML